MLINLRPRQYGKTLEHRAELFATEAHAGQKRKWTGEPYIGHPARVADLVMQHGHGPQMTAAAWLHDTVEDCGVDPWEIAELFGPVVHVLVEHLTKPNEAPIAMSQTIKLADIADNCRDIAEVAPPDDALAYLAIKQAQLERLDKGDPRLWVIAQRRISAGMQLAQKRLRAAS